MSHFGKPAHDQMLAAIEACRAQGLDVPTLALTYTLLDALAWAAYGGSMNQVKERFLHLCEQHLLGKVQFSCTPLDLYAARCSILHTLGWESDLSKSGKAKSLFYSFGTDNSATTQAVLDRVSPGKFVGVKADELIAATREVIVELRALAAANPALRARLEQASGKGYRTLDSRHSEVVFQAFLNVSKPSDT